MTARVHVSMVRWMDVTVKRVCVHICTYYLLVYFPRICLELINTSTFACLVISLVPAYVLCRHNFHKREPRVPGLKEEKKKTPFPFLLFLPCRLLFASKARQ